MVDCKSQVTSFNRKGDYVLEKRSSVQNAQTLRAGLKVTAVGKVRVERDWELCAHANGNGFQTPAQE